MVSTEINPHIYRQMSFNMSVKIIHWGKDSLFNKWCWGNYGPFFPPSNVPSGHHKKNNDQNSSSYFGTSKMTSIIQE